MRHRRRSSEESSLELLLDTICNTFGGILFISLLVVILLNSTSEAVDDTPPPHESQAGLVQIDIERDELTQELDRLKDAVAQQEHVRGTIVPKEILDLAEKLKNMKGHHVTAVAGKSHALGGINGVQIKLNGIAQRDTELRKDHDNAKSRLAAVLHVLNQKVSANTRKAVMPKVRQSSVEQRVYFLRGGKLYGPHLEHGGVNTAEFVEVQQGGTKFLDINPNGGVQVNPDGNNTDELAAKFSGLDPADFGTTVFVWPDSYGHFDAVRVALGEVALGYELVPVDDGTMIRIGDDSASGSIPLQY